MAKDIVTPKPVTVYGIDDDLLVLIENQRAEMEKKRKYRVNRNEAILKALTVGLKSECY